MSSPPEQLPGRLIIIPYGKRKIWDKHPNAGPTAQPRRPVASSAVRRQGGLRGEVPCLVWAQAFSAQPPSEPSGHLSMHWALR